LDDIIAERDACGVGYIASLKNEYSHKVVKDALTSLGCMEHRGGCGADNDSGDGAGVMTSIPWGLFAKWLQEQGLPAVDESHCGVGQVFLPRDETLAASAKAVVEEVFKKEGVEVLAWRPVPVTESVVGQFAKITMPRIEQIFVKVAAEDAVDDIERELYLSRKLIEKAASTAPWGDDFYFCSLSSRTIVYKGMLRSEAVGQFYDDLRNEDYTTQFAIYHRRFSTNTTPKWPLAQPMRFLGHNGEINTLQGNLNWMRSREAIMESPIWRGRDDELRPFGNIKASDSANLDMVAEVLSISFTKQV
jgi:glutamate synthase (ferredoxin)